MREFIGIIGQIETACFSSPWSVGQLESSLQRGTSLICILYQQEERLFVRTICVQEGRLTKSTTDRQGSWRAAPRDKERDVLAIGFVFFKRPVSSEPVELYRIGMIPAFQSQGRASFLLSHALAKLPTAFPESDRILLEVRQDNAPALALYHKHGFQKIHTRRGYYGNYDAIIMERRLR